MVRYIYIDNANSTNQQKELRPERRSWLGSVACAPGYPCSLQVYRVSGSRHRHKLLGCEHHEVVHLVQALKHRTRTPYWTRSASRSTLACIIAHRSKTIFCKTIKILKYHYLLLIVNK